MPLFCAVYLQAACPHTQTTLQNHCHKGKLEKILIHEGFADPIRNRKYQSFFKKTHKSSELLLSVIQGKKKNTAEIAVHLLPLVWHSSKN